MRPRFVDENGLETRKTPLQSNQHPTAYHCPDDGLERERQANPTINLSFRPMGSRLPIPAFIKSRFSFETKFAIRRMLEDLGPSVSFMLSPFKQRRAREDCNRCESIQDYLEFTQKHLGKGSIQRLSEIEAVIEYIRPELPQFACEIGTDYGLSLIHI